ncbi:Hypothetical predicted protein [Pelobates cultripes]|uniref:Uncharacterized protein n=1 Tax=Pelobates cultripes TaxID=61616 RepID=A0AAD1WJ95_PELCU|nr:Hypothetical predicted protein [Pelobates cultripes]
MCLNRMNINITKNNVSADIDWCNLLAPNNTREFYFRYGNGTNYTCVTYCTMGVPGRLNCNYGECHVLAKSGPRCLCPDTNEFWYSGESCDSRISRPGVIGGVTAAIVILILIAIITIILCRRRKSKGNQELLTNKNIDFTNPDEMESEWTSGQNITGHPPAEGNKFTPNLQSVDIFKKVQIRRPTLIRTPESSD